VARISDNKFWLQWIVANSLAELAGLGTVALAGYGIVLWFGEPTGSGAVLFAMVFVILGAFEGLVVGLAQSRVLKQRVAALRGWVRATVVGAVVAWVLGMLPSTIMSLATPAEATQQAPAISDAMQLLLAAMMGLVAGPVLAFFQWLTLRRYVLQHSIWWLPANAAAWALGMPVIFIGVDFATASSSPIAIVTGVGLSLLIAGAVVGAVHGRVLAWLIKPYR